MIDLEGNLIKDDGTQLLFNGSLLSFPFGQESLEDEIITILGGGPEIREKL